MTSGAPNHELGMVIPAERLPKGFAESLGGPPPLSPAVPKPAATVVLMRDGADGIEVLLLKRHRDSGFVPGAYVFAGGRVDDADADSALIATLDAPPTDPPPSYWLAAIREVFEETGVLLVRDSDSLNLERAAELREALMTDRATLLDVVNGLDVRPDIDALAYSAHWITPLAEPRRYDTRFFYAAAPAGCNATADPREMSDAVWLTPAEALARFQNGRLPMVFPTVKTLQGLLKCRNVNEALESARSSTIKPILPSLVRVAGGVGIVIDADEGPRDK